MQADHSTRRSDLGQFSRNSSVSRVPDRKGNILPVGVDSATYDLRDLTPGSHNLMANGMAVDGHVGTACSPQLSGVLPLPEDLGGIRMTSTCHSNDTGLGRGLGDDSVHRCLREHFRRVRRLGGAHDSAIATYPTLGKVRGVARLAPSTGPQPAAMSGRRLHIRAGPGVAPRRGRRPYQVNPSTPHRRARGLQHKGRPGWVRNVTNQVQYVRFAICGLRPHGRQNQ